jgi:hypothetical protein
MPLQLLKNPTRDDRRTRITEAVRSGVTSTFSEVSHRARLESSRQRTNAAAAAGCQSQRAGASNDSNTNQKIIDHDGHFRRRLRRWSVDQLIERIDTRIEYTRIRSSDRSSTSVG